MSYGNYGVLRVMEETNLMGSASCSAGQIYTSVNTLWKKHVFYYYKAVDP